MGYLKQYIDSVGELRDRARRVAEQSLHDLWTIRVALKIWADASRGGVEVWGIEKEYRLGDDSAIRCDMKFHLGERLFFLETQQTALTFRGWKHKLSKYAAYRRKHGPFRVLVVMENTSNLNTVYRYTKEVTADRPSLCLFLLAWQNDLLGHYDVVNERVWVSNRVVKRRPETVALLR